MFCAALSKQLDCGRILLIFENGSDTCAQRQEYAAILLLWEGAVPESSIGGALHGLAYWCCVVFGRDTQSDSAVRLKSPLWSSDSRLGESVCGLFFGKGFETDVRMSVIPEETAACSKGAFTPRRAGSQLRTPHMSFSVRHSSATEL